MTVAKIKKCEHLWVYERPLHADDVVYICRFCGEVLIERGGL